jgi:hypothetical protein
MLESPSSQYLGVFVAGLMAQGSVLKPIVSSILHKLEAVRLTKAKINIPDIEAFYGSFVFKSVEIS